MSRKKLLITVLIFTLLIIALIIVLNPSHEYNKLSISESKWNSIKKSRTESNSMVLTEIKFNDYKLIVDENNNALYYSLINNSQNKYNPNVSYSSNKSNVKLAILSDEITDEKVKSNYHFKIMIYDDKEYHVYDLKCTDLPILNISYNRNEDISQKSTPTMEMYLFDNLTNNLNKITISRGVVKMNENDYMFSLHMLTPGKNKRDIPISLLNMKPSSDYILTKVDNIESNEEVQDIDQKKHIVEVFMNNEYKGIYYLEHI